jgi:hypothetical protein
MLGLVLAGCMSAPGMTWEQWREQCGRRGGVWTEAKGCTVVVTP